MTDKTLLPASAAGRARRRLGVPVVAAVVIAVLVAGGGREPRFRELGFVAGG